MNRRHLKIGLLTACLVTGGSFAAAQNCDSHSKTCSCQSQKPCDNAGLMSLLNDAATSFEDRLARMIPDLPDKSNKPSCGCSKCKSAGAISYSQPHIAPPTIHEADASPPIPTPVPQEPQVPIPAPKPPTGVRTPELVPVPDKQVDPFKDENARRVRPVPARPATLKRSETTYGQNFDPQASLRAVQLSTAVDHVTNTPITRHDLALETSSRKPLNSIRLQIEPTPSPLLNANAVVTASATGAKTTGAKLISKPTSAEAPAAPAKIVGQGRPIVEPAYHNPLRNP